jgi:hypothetical protein
LADTIRELAEAVEEIRLIKEQRDAALAEAEAEEERLRAELMGVDGADAVNRMYVADLEKENERLRACMQFLIDRKQAEDLEFELWFVRNELMQALHANEHSSPPPERYDHADDAMDLMGLNKHPLDALTAETERLGLYDTPNPNKHSEGKPLLGQCMGCGQQGIDAHNHECDWTEHPDTRIPMQAIGLCESCNALLWPQITHICTRARDAI